MFLVIAFHSGSGHGPSSSPILITDQATLAFRLARDDDQLAQLGYYFSGMEQGVAIVELMIGEAYSKKDHESTGEPSQPKTTHHAPSYFRRKVGDSWEEEWSSQEFRHRCI
jgi:hypothetical protein